MTFKKVKMGRDRYENLPKTITESVIMTEEIFCSTPETFQCLLETPLIILASWATQSKQAEVTEFLETITAVSKTMY